MNSSNGKIIIKNAQKVSGKIVKCAIQKVL